MGLAPKERIVLALDEYHHRHADLAAAAAGLYIERWAKWIARLPQALAHSSSMRDRAINPAVKSMCVISTRRASCGM